MNKEVGMLLKKRDNTSGVGISNMQISTCMYVPLYNNTH